MASLATRTGGAAPASVEDIALVPEDEHLLGTQASIAQVVHKKNVSGMLLLHILKKNSRSNASSLKASAELPGLIIPPSFFLNSRKNESQKACCCAYFLEYGNLFTSSLEATLSF